jgi:23S rRNA U2552 (ribose-2'-O)-methylase RlmE/FtsJ
MPPKKQVKKVAKAKKAVSKKAPQPKVKPKVDAPPKVPDTAETPEITTEEKAIQDSPEIELELSKDEKYDPIVFKLSKLTKDQDITNSKINPNFSSNIDYPKFSLGFHHYIHQSKDKMEIVEQFEGKKRVYLVMNEFERYIDDYDKSIGAVSKDYFSIKQQPNILSRAFYKLWELLFMFDLVPLDKDNFVSAHLAEGPGSFIQATMFYRDMFAKKGLSKNDKYHAVTLHPEDIRKHIPPLGESFVKYYAKEKPNRFMQHRTVPKKVAKQSGGKRDNGDITKRSTIKLFADDMKGKKAHFITADGGFEWKNENTQEQEAFKLILGQIIAALKIQAPSGNFVIKMFESFTSTSVKFMCILSSFYEHVYAVKPLTSRKSNSEKYIVCLGYNGANKDKKIAELEGVLDQFIKNKGMQLVDVYPDYEIPKDYMATVTKLNTTVANRQFESINEIVAFIEKQNYRGEEYHTRRKMQIDASEYWIDTFYPKQSEFTNKKKQIQKSRDGLVQYNANLATVLASKLN